MGTRERMCSRQSCRFGLTQRVFDALLISPFRLALHVPGALVIRAPEFRLGRRRRPIVKFQGCSSAWM